MNNIFVIYALGSGGQHVSNLISQDQQFVPQCSPADYNNLSSAAHFSYQYHLHTLDSIPTETLAQQSRVYPHHIHSLLRVDPSRLKAIPNKIYLVLELPEYNKAIAGRMARWGFEAQGQAYDELKLLYSPYILSLILQEPIDKFFGISCEDVWQPDGATLLTHIQNSSPIDLNWNLHTLSIMHEKWYKKIAAPEYIS